MNQISYIDNIIIVVSLLIILYIGISSGRGIKSIQNYKYHYRKIDPAMLGLNFTMVIFGSGALFGSTSEIYKLGIIYIMASFGYVISNLIAAKYIVPKLDHKYENLLSISDIMKSIYGSEVEIFVSIIAFIFDIFILACQFITLGNFLAYFYSISYLEGMCLGLIAAITYSCLSGIRIIIGMDIVKCSALLIVVPIFASIVVYKAGGLIAITNHLTPDRLLLFSHPEFYQYAALFVFISCPFHIFQPAILQRILLINNNKIATSSLYMYSLVRSILIWITATIGLATFVLIPNINSKYVLVTSIVTMLPNILKSFTLVAAFIIIICKIDSHVNSIGFIAINNFLPKKLITKFSDIFLFRVFTILACFLAALVALSNVSIFKITIFSELILGIFIGIPLIAKLFKFKIAAANYWKYNVVNTLVLLIAYIFLQFSYLVPPLVIILSILIYTLIYKNQKKDILDYTNDNVIHTLRFSLKHILLSIKKFIPTLDKMRIYSKQRVDMIGADYFTFGIYFSVNYSISYFMWEYQTEVSNLAVLIRLFSGVLCLFLLLKNLWPEKLKKYFPLYWHFTLMINLPFLTCFMLLLQNWEIVWLINMSLSILLLVLLTDWMSFIILSSLGVLISILLYKITIGPLYLSGNINIDYLAVYTFIISILIGFIFARRKEKLLDTKVEVAQILAGTIAHEMRTFLLIIKNYSSGLSNHLPVLIEGYEQAKMIDLIDTHIPQDQQDVIKNAFQNIDKTLRKSFSFIDLLLINIKGPALSENKKLFIVACLNEILEEYPATIIERQYIHFNKKNDFLFIGNQAIFTHVIFNLLNNAFYFIKNCQFPKIGIWLEKTSTNNYLHITDNGPGIDNHEIPLVFSKFYSKNKKGTGLGLSYCKLAMNYMGGDILCHSIKGKYTEFILKFPTNNGELYD